jgi:hypothetical protein
LIRRASSHHKLKSQDWPGPVRRPKQVRGPSHPQPHVPVPVPSRMLSIYYSLQAALPRETVSDALFQLSLPRSPRQIVSAVRLDNKDTVKARYGTVLKSIMNQQASQPQTVTDYPVPVPDREAALGRQVVPGNRPQTITGTVTAQSIATPSQKLPFRGLPARPHAARVD